MIINFNKAHVCVSTKVKSKAEVGTYLPHPMLKVTSLPRKLGKYTYIVKILTMN